MLKNCWYVQEDLQNGDEEDEDEEDAQRRRSSIDNYTGVSIKVRKV